MGACYSVFFTARSAAEGEYQWQGGGQQGEWHQWEAPRYLYVARDGKSFHTTPDCEHIQQNRANEIIRRTRLDDGKVIEANGLLM